MTFHDDTVFVGFVAPSENGAPHCVSLVRRSVRMVSLTLRGFASDMCVAP
jgi:hypothetical protein